MRVKKSINSGMEEKGKIIISDYPKYFIIRKDEKFLFCFGAVHSYDPDDKQFPIIEKLWKKFLSVTKRQKKITLVEGGKRPYIKNRKDAINEGGEASFIAHLAGKKNIPINCPEPDEKSTRKELLKKFSKENIQLYYFLLVAYQWNNLTKKENFDKYINDFLLMDEKTSGWKNFDFSLENMVNIFESKTNKKFKKDNKNLFYSLINPDYNKSLINKISRRSAEIRDNAIVKNIVKLWKSDISIFIVYGNGHTPIFRKKLENILS